MAIQVIGMAFIISAIISALGALIEFLVKIFTKKFVIVAAITAVLVAITIAFYAAIKATMEAIIVTAPPEVTQYIGLFLPSNFEACMSALVTAKLARWTYDFKKNLINLKAVA